MKANGIGIDEMILRRCPGPAILECAPRHASACRLPRTRWRPAPRDNAALRRVVCAVGCVLALFLSRRAAAEPPTASPTAVDDVAPKQQQSVVPRPVLPPPPRSRYVADPLADGAVLSLSLGSGLLSELILETGEISPQQPRPETDLLAIDRPSITAQPIPTWGTVSTVGLGAALAYAAADAVFSGYRNGVESGIVDGVIYAETVSVTWAVTNLAKISFRRPRPVAYQEQARREASGDTANPEELTDTNSAMSFFSGHASITASVAAASTYLAFSRSADRLRPWLTLGVGTVLTTAVAFGRVKAGEHFPTDVIAGAMVGAGIGVLVPHLHREETARRRSVWIGFGAEPGGASIRAQGLL
jgi:membrane-associated phospholipid phosphatase